VADGNWRAGRDCLRHVAPPADHLTRSKNRVFSRTLTLETERPLFCHSPSVMPAVSAATDECTRQTCYHSSGRGISAEVDLSRSKSAVWDIVAGRRLPLQPARRLPLRRVLTSAIYVPKSAVGNPRVGDLLGAIGGKTITGDTPATNTLERSTTFVDHTFVKGNTDNSYPAATYMVAGNNACTQ
jgi:hypothetical protein